MTTSRRERLLDSDVWENWRAVWPSDVEGLIEQRRAWIEAHHAPTVTLEGSGTFVAAEAVSPWVDSHRPDEALFVDYMPRRASRWFVVVDSRGRVDWQFTGDDETALLLLVCRDTPSGYLKHLRAMGVGYLVVGDERVDLGVALQQLGSVLGARAVVADGGGGLNGALLRAGLIDEAHVITFPALIGGLGTPTFVDGPALSSHERPTALRTLALQQGHAGSVWARYEVEHTAPRSV